MNLESGNQLITRSYGLVKGDEMQCDKQIVPSFIVVSQGNEA